METLRHRSPLLAGALLAVLTVTVFVQTLGFDFVSFDDPAFIGGNATVQAGFSREGLRWALTTSYVGNWAPITWLSHMLDVELFGLEPIGHHLSNLVYHLLNVVLLLGLLYTLTGRLWRSALVAGLFAVHPLNVECVAWVAQQKTLLSTLFALLFLFCYIRFARTKSQLAYGGATLFLILGLLSKAVLIVLPGLLLLIDYWPLRRWPAEPNASADGGSGAASTRASSLSTLILEKWLWLLVSMGVAAATIFAQRGAGAVSEGQVPAALRLANALVAAARYLAKALWPRDLAVLYPHPNLPGGEPYLWWQIAGCAALLVVVSGFVIRHHRRRYLVFGWFWFLVAMAPTIGLIQVGEQAMADRYFYLPGVGLLAGIVWGVAEWAEARGPVATRWAGAAGVVVLIVMATAAFRQTTHWQNSRTLYEHTLRVEPSNPMILSNLGVVELNVGNLHRAEELFTRAVALRPFFVEARTSLAGVVALRGDYPYARQQIDIVLELHPSSVEGLVTRSRIEFDTQDYAGAIADLERALKLDPGNQAIRLGLEGIRSAQREFLSEPEGSRE